MQTQAIAVRGECVRTAPPSLNAIHHHPLLNIDKSNKHNSNSIEKYMMLPVYVNNLN